MKISTFYIAISTNQKTERYVILWLVLEKVKISVALAFRQTVVRSLSTLVQSLDVFGFNTFMTDCYPLGVCTVKPCISKSVYQNAKYDCN